MGFNKRLLDLVFGCLAVLFCWYILAMIINRPILPLPHVALKEFAALFPGLLWQHTLVSLFRILVSLLAATLLAVPLGLILGQAEQADRIIGPMIYVLYPIPKVVFLPIILILLGLGNFSKIFFITIIVFFQILVTTRDAAKMIPRQMVLSMNSLGANQYQTYHHLVFPICLPKIFTSLRISLGTAIAVLFLSETYATSEGLGYLIMDAMSRVAYSEMFAGILAMSLMGLVLYLLIDFLESVFCRWQSF